MVSLPSTPIRLHTCVAFLIFLMSLVPCAFAQASKYKWQVVKAHGRDYITAKSIVGFYSFDKMTQDGNVIRFHDNKLSMRGRIGSQTLDINKIKFIMSFPMIRHQGHILISRLDLCKLIDPVLRPSYIKRPGGIKTVVLDPGHGGHDSGAYCTLGKESYFALDTAKHLKKELEKRGYRVVMTRTTDRYITLGDRVKFANRYKNAIFVSLHYNSGQSRAYGIETFALSPHGSSSTYTGRRRSDYVNFDGNENDSENIALSTAIHAAAMHNIRTIDRGIKRARWTVLTGLRIPGVLFEGGFLSNPREARLVASSAHRKKIAKAIAQGIDRYKKAVTK